ncbi:VOC family protein [Nocardia anaemiae]|uniref:VOC family protein n=1 Tax=Nocardia anaemiae TaxID=263910 RepID=UPI000A71B64D|nr:VOC family protein [Nocardia anaemiae]
MTSRQVESPHEVGRSGAARQEFAQSFASLYEMAGSPSLRVVASSARGRVSPETPISVSAQRISDWKAGRNVPARFEALKPVLLVLCERARRRGPVASRLLDLRAWRLLWRAAQRPREGRRAEAVRRCSPRLDLVDSGAERQKRGEAMTESSRPAGISLGCDEPATVVGFYLELLGGCLLWSNDDSAGIRTPSGFTVVAQRVENYTTPSWPNTPIVYFGLPEGVDPKECEMHALKIGAKPASVQPGSQPRVLLDPAGHPFCVMTCTR